MRKAIFTIIVFFALLLMLEGTFRVYRYLAPEAFGIEAFKENQEMPLVPNEDFLFDVGPSNTPYALNSLGWRGNELTDPKPKNSTRILFLGDSSVWGWEIEKDKAFPWLAGKILQEKTGKSVEVANAAKPGYSSEQLRLVFKENIDIVEPDIVVIASLWSDIATSNVTDKERLAGKIQKKDMKEKSRLAFRASALFSYLEIAIENFKDDSDRRIEAPHQPKQDMSILNGPKRRVSVSDHRANLDFFISESKKRGALPVLLILHCDPSEIPWPPKLLGEYRKNFFRVAKENHVPLVDAKALFPRDSKQLGQFFMDGLHPSPKGHQVIANALADIISHALSSPDN